MSKASEIISLLCRAFLVGMWYLAAWDKILDPASFAQAMAAYDLMPLWGVNAGSVLMAWLELWLGTFLLLGLWIRPAALWTVGLMLLFTGLMVHVGYTGRVQDCGCFSAFASQAGYADAVRDLLLMLPAVWLLWRPGTWLTLDAWLARRGSPAPQAA